MSSTEDEKREKVLALVVSAMASTGSYLITVMDVEKSLMARETTDKIMEVFQEGEGKS